MCNLYFHEKAYKTNCEMQYDDYTTCVYVFSNRNFSKRNTLKL